MKITSSQQKALQEIGRKHNLNLILLYGSQARGVSREGSDLDIAVLGNEPLSFQAFTALRSDLENIFGDSPERELDVVSLHRKDPLFLYQVAKGSEFLYGSPTDYATFRAHAFKQYFDSADLRALEATLARKFQAHLNKKYA